MVSLTPPIPLLRVCSIPLGTWNLSTLAGFWILSLFVAFPWGLETIRRYRYNGVVVLFVAFPWGLETPAPRRGEACRSLFVAFPWGLETVQKVLKVCFLCRLVCSIPLGTWNSSCLLTPLNVHIVCSIPLGTWNLFCSKFSPGGVNFVCSIPLGTWNQN